MSFFNFSPSISLAIKLLLIAGISYFFIHKLNRQNSKISSMVGVISSLTDELYSIKAYIHNTNNSVNRGCESKSESESDSYQHNLQSGGLGVSIPTTNTCQKIVVSDDDSDSDSVDSDSVDSDSDSDSDDDEEDDGSDSIDVVVGGKNGKIKIINMEKGYDINNIDETNGVIDLTNDSFSDDIVENVKSVSEDMNDSSEFSSSSEEEVEEEEDLELEELEEENVSSSVGEEKVHNSDSSVIDMSIDLLTNYKNLSVGKLRDILVEKGVMSHTDAMKINKIKALKMLGV